MSNPSKPNQGRETPRGSLS